MSERPQPMVRLRCGSGRCRRVLASFDAPPPSWDGTAQVWGCPDHDGFSRPFFNEVRRRAARGLDPMPQTQLHLVKWADLRHLFFLADTRGKTVDDELRRA